MPNIFTQSALLRLLPVLILLLSSSLVLAEKGVVQAVGSCTKALLGETAAHVLQENGYTYLKHRTEFEKLLAIVKDHALTPPSVRLRGRKNRGSISRTDAVFFDVVKYELQAVDHPYGRGFGAGGGHEVRENGRVGFRHAKGLRTVQFEFSLNALEDNRNFHISSNGWNYGDRLESDYVNAPGSQSNAIRLQEFLKKDRAGELVMEGPVSLNHLRSIRIVEIYRDEVISKLKNAGVSQINGRPVGSVVQSIPITVPYEVQSDGSVILYFEDP